MTLSLESASPFCMLLCCHGQVIHFTLYVAVLTQGCPLTLSLEIASPFCMLLGCHGQCHECCLCVELRSVAYVSHSAGATSNGHVKLCQWLPPLVPCHAFSHYLLTTCTSDLFFSYPTLLLCSPVAQQSWAPTPHSLAASLPTATSALATRWRLPAAVLASTLPPT